jgi:hypothetical protein
MDLKEMSYDMDWIHLAQNRAVFHNLCSPTAHPNLSKTHNGTSKNFAS